jgi:hypothetical protein
LSLLGCSPAVNSPPDLRTAWLAHTLFNIFVVMTWWWKL